MYNVLKHTHISLVLLSIVLLWWRMVWRWWWPEALARAQWLRWLPHVLDTLLLASALGLCWLLQQWPFVQPWLTAKVLALFAYIIFSSLAYKRATTRSGQVLAFVLAQCCVLYIIGVALYKTPWSWLVL